MKAIGETTLIPNGFDWPIAEEFPLLGTVDQAGWTALSHGQMHWVIPELTRLLAATSGREDRQCLTSILRLARTCASQLDTALVFTGA